MELTKEQLANILQIDTRTVRKYKDEGMPHKKFKNSFLYPARESITWCLLNGKLDDILEQLENTDELAPNIRKDLADAKLKEFKLAVEQGKYYLKEEIDKKAEYIITSTKNKLLSMGNKIAPTLVGIEETNEVKNIIDNVNYEILEELSKLDELV